MECDHEFVAYFASSAAAASWHRSATNIRVVLLRSAGSIPRIVAEIPVRCVRDRIDVLHVQYFAPPVSPVSFVPMIHDVSYSVYPETFGRGDRARFALGIPWTIRRARRVLTVSQHSKRDIAERYHLAPERIDVAYPGVDVGDFTSERTPSDVEILARHGVRAPYILAVGNLQPRKNLVRLLTAFAHVRNDRPDAGLRLVLVGKPALHHERLERAIYDAGLAEHVDETGYVPRSDLPALYRSAAAFCYPSLYEGFGLPVLEAMACGTPVITSTSSSLPEVAGSAAILVDPGDERAIAAGLLQVLDSNEVQATLARAGVARARQFSWDATARAVIASLEAGR
jgi:glycosyltransferase involved in cell wall biosynthesis